MTRRRGTGPPSRLATGGCGVVLGVLAAGIPLLVAGPPASATPPARGVHATPVSVVESFLSALDAGHVTVASHDVDPADQAAFRTFATADLRQLGAGGPVSLSGARSVAGGPGRALVTVTLVPRGKGTRHRIGVPAVEVASRWYVDWTVLGPQLEATAAGDENRAAQSDLVNAVTSAKALYTQSGDYPSTGSAAVAGLGDLEPELTFTVGPAIASGHAVSVASSPQELTVAALSATGTCWYANDNESAGVVAGRPVGLSYASSTGVGCQADEVPATVPWSASFAGSG